MVTIVWDTISFHPIDTMPKGEKYSARYYTDKILIPICAVLILHGTRKSVIHADDSCCENAKVVLEFVSQQKVRCAPHPPCSPDLAPSDFFLFDYLKRELSGSFFQRTE
jgi:hypothetical protein